MASQILPRAPQLRHIRRIGSLIQHVRLSHNQPKHTSTPDPIEWLPLPRSLSPRKALMLLSLPIPPKFWPSHVEMSSSLLASTSAKFKDRGIAVNAIYDGVGNETRFQDKEEYKMRVFWPDGHYKVYNKFNLENIKTDELGRELEYISESLDVVEGEGDELKEILVCTHGSRDCRCSDRGGPLVEALRGEVQRRGVGDKVKISEVAHVGGHKYATNAILLPTLDMLSNLTLEHAPSLVSHVLSPKPESILWQHWRGRYGLTEEEQAKVWDKINSTSTSTSTASQEEENVIVKEVEKVELKFKTFEGELNIVNAKLGSNLLEVGKENNLPSLEGVCGGNLECATCHLYLSSNILPPPTGEASDEEFDMLGYALGFKDGESRLGCQVVVTKELGEWCKKGGVIGLPRF